MGAAPSRNPRDLGRPEDFVDEVTRAASKLVRRLDLGDELKRDERVERPEVPPVAPPGETAAAARRDAEGVDHREPSTAAAPPPPPSKERLERGVRLVALNLRARATDA